MRKKKNSLNFVCEEKLALHPNGSDKCIFQWLDKIFATFVGSWNILFYFFLIRIKKKEYQVNLGEVVFVQSKLVEVFRESE